MKAFLSKLMKCVPSVLEDLGANRWDRNEKERLKCAFCPCISQRTSPLYIHFLATGQIAGVLSLSFSLICTWTQKEVEDILCNIAVCYILTADVFFELHK